MFFFSFQGEGFDVMKSGDARVALVGFPSVGKVSSFLISLHFVLDYVHYLMITRLPCVILYCCVLSLVHLTEPPNDYSQCGSFL